MAKERADVLCVSQGLFESREKAKRAIMAGIVYNENIRSLLISTNNDLAEASFIQNEYDLKNYNAIITGHKEILTKISQYMDNRPKEIEKEIEEVKKTDTIKKSVNDDFEDDFVDKKKGDFEYGR